MTTLHDKLVALGPPPTGAYEYGTWATHVAASYDELLAATAPQPAAIGEFRGMFADSSGLDLALKIIDDIRPPLDEGEWVFDYDVARVRGEPPPQPADAQALTEPDAWLQECRGKGRREIMAHVGPEKPSVGMHERMDRLEPQPLFLRATKAADAQARIADLEAECERLRGERSLIERKFDEMAEAAAASLAYAHRDVWHQAARYVKTYTRTEDVTTKEPT